MNFVRETKLCYIDLAAEVDIKNFDGLHFHGPEEITEVRCKQIGTIKKTEDMTTIVLKNMSKTFDQEHFKAYLGEIDVSDCELRVQATSLGRNFAFLDLPKKYDKAEFRSAIQDYRNEEQTDALIVEDYDKKKAKSEQIE